MKLTVKDTTLTIRAFGLFGCELIEQAHYADDDGGDDEDAQVAGAHDRQGFHQKINTHIINLQSLP